MVLYTISPENEVKPGVIVNVKDLLKVIAIDDSRLRRDIDQVVPQILDWGRLVALQKRVWTLREREYRTWKARQELAIRSAGKDSKDGWGTGGKVSADQVEAIYRTSPDYAVVSRAVEEAEEAYLFADVVYRAMKTKADVLMADVRRVPDGSLQRLSP